MAGRRDKRTPKLNSRENPVVRFAFAIAALSCSLLMAAFARAGETRTRATGGCGEAGLALFTSPANPWKGSPLKVMATSETALEGELTLRAPDGSAAASSKQRRGGPPYFWIAQVSGPVAGTWTATLTRSGIEGPCKEVTREIAVRKTRPSAIGTSKTTVWPIRAKWNAETESLYAAWIEALFDAPLEETLSWPALHEVLRNKERNFLFNHLGGAEDEKNVVIRPDCADLPYFLRGYFAFKLGLPFGYSKCNRGGGGSAPRCSSWWSIAKEEPVPLPENMQKRGGALGGLFDEPQLSPVRKPQRPSGLAQGFGHYLRQTVANSVHSGSARTRLSDDATDYYPVPLDQKTLRPGTIYADPYGHILVLVKRLAQSGDAAGLFLAVDGQPDGTVARKRFWRGNFLFAQDPALGGPGFKRFRPIVAEKGGVLRRLSNAEIANHPGYGDFALDQSNMSIEDFYDRMDEVMSPSPLDPSRALLEAIAALEEQVTARVTSVENGRKYQEGGGAEANMPDGAAIFETTGAWEDFATPSRDLRLLIAIDVVLGFPGRVANKPERYAMPPGKSPADVKSDLDTLLERELASRKVSYTRSDGSAWTLTLKDVSARAQALEMAYNVNDCVELRWGAPEDSDEAKTCKRRASEAQRAKMGKYRTWFAERRRPPRG